MYTLDNAPLSPDQRANLANTIASFAIEDMHVDADDIDRAIRVQLGECSLKQAEEEILRKYKVDSDGQ